MKTHVVQFQGAFPSTSLSSMKRSYAGLPNIKEINSSGYCRPPENSKARLDVYTEEYVKFINKLDKDNLTILDFGGGLGGHYLTLKENCSEKDLDYSIVDLPEAFTEIDNVNYYESVEKACLNIGKQIDVIYSNGTIFLTKEISVDENIIGFCKAQADYIFLQRMIISKGSAYEHFYTFVPVQGSYYSIIDYDALINLTKQHGYDLVSEYPTNTRFEVNNSPSNIGEVCYSNFLFKRINEK